MGRLARVLEFIKGERNGAKMSEAKVDASAGQTIQAEHFGTAGTESHPLPEDYALLVEVARKGGHAVAGYLDPRTDQKCEPGETRIYARDAAGATVVEVYLQNDGTATISNDAATFTVRPSGEIKADNGAGNFALLDNGDVLINNVRIKPNGDTSIPTKVETPSAIVNGKEIKDHRHSGVITGGSNTGPNV